MPRPNEQVEATRLLLHEVCRLLAPHVADSVLIGGWVPDILFPDARPAHIGSVDVDMALRLQREQLDAVLLLLAENHFRPGPNPYQFYKDVLLPSGRTIPARLDLLTTQQHRAEALANPSHAPSPMHGVDIAFRNNTLIAINPADGVEARVAGIVAFLVMKSIALAERTKPKDAYDIHFCLEHHREGVEGIAAEFSNHFGDELILEARTVLEEKFRDEESEGPQMVADVEELHGEYRAMRKLEVAGRVQELLNLIREPSS
jgi:hypothetical protein